LTGASLTGVPLTGVPLTGASLAGVSLVDSGCGLFGSLFLDEEPLAGNRNTLM